MAISLEELTANANFTRNVKGKVTLLPDPPRAERRYLMISCDDHIVEPPHAFEGRVAAKLADRAPRVVDQGLIRRPIEPAVANTAQHRCGDHRGCRVLGVCPGAIDDVAPHPVLVVKPRQRRHVLPK